MQLLSPALRPAAFGLVACVDFVERMLASSGSLYKLLLVPGFERLRWRIGVWRAWRSFYRTYRDVPAYRQFIDTQGGRPRIRLAGDFLPDLRSIPEMDKDSYVKKFPLEQRVRGGVLPHKGVTVDESSGSSGQPTSWVRGRIERRITSQMIRLTYRSSVHKDDRVFILNAFALGAWATGMNISISLTDTSIIKSTGPNADKIINTMKEFGPSFRYVIMGYPPFLKGLADDPRIDWSAYTVDAGFGGEGISESLRSYLLTKFKRVVGSYGASDLEINMAVETDLTIRLRRALLEDARLRAALIRTDYGVTPMIFQYNPLAYLLETNEKGELVVTISRPYNIAPKIRYNIHDRGHVAMYGALREKLAAANRMDVLEGIEPNVDLPLLFIYGRSDMSIEYYGATVTPDSIREILYGVSELTPILNTFRLVSYEDDAHNKRMEIAVELTKGAPPPADAAALADRVFRRLGEMNGDFYNAMFRTAPADNMPRLTLHAFETGPFAGGQRKLKNEYVGSNLKYDRL
jgi:phenylacetate-coenzyme A ligase PaaK-like adenylate-forming protein